MNSKFEAMMPMYADKISRLYKMGRLDRADVQFFKEFMRKGNDEVEHLDKIVSDKDEENFKLWIEFTKSEQVKDTLIALAFRAARHTEDAKIKAILSKQPDDIDTFVDLHIQVNESMCIIKDVYKGLFDFIGNEVNNYQDLDKYIAEIMANNG
jgi:hypothetical protein